MKAFLENLVTASIHGSVVILAVILLRLVLRKTPRKYICLLWLLAGIRLLMPIEIRSDLSLQPAFTLPDMGLATLKWAAVLPWIWGVIAACFGIYSLVSYRKLKRKVVDAVKIQGGWECDGIDTAFILGFIKPRIYIPFGMNGQARKHILEHERTHLDKGDHWIKMIAFLALALHWFNPLVWVAYILLCKDIEMACDERVVQFMEVDERKAYSAALLSCSSKQMHFSANPVAFGEVSVKQRIMNVLKYKKPGFWISLLGVLAFFFVAVCLLTNPAEKAEPVIVELPSGAYIEASPEEQEQTITLLQTAWDTILEGETYHLFFAEETYEGSVGWQVNIYKDGENTLWTSTDHINREGQMVLDGVHYTLIDGNEGGWVAYGEDKPLLDSLVEEFSLDGKVLTDIVKETKTNDAGYTYEKLSFCAHSTDESGKTITQPMEAYFDTDGAMTSMRVETTSRKGADIFTFHNWGMRNDINDLDGAFENAKEHIVPIDSIHPSKLQEPTLDEQRMKEWGIQLQMDDDLLTRYGGEVWFCLSEGYDMVIHTDNTYWLEKRTDTGWEKLETIGEPQWTAASYTLGHGMYTMVFTDWSELYGPLSSGTYRMGKTFERIPDGVGTCVGYAEFEIFVNESNSTDQNTAVERCYAALEELKSRESIHWLSIMGRNIQKEFWVNGEDYLCISRYNGPEAPQEEWSEHDKQLFPRVDTMVRYQGVGYETVRKNPDVLSSEVLGMQLSTLSPDRAGWTRGTIAEDFNMSFFERSNHAIDFPEGIGIVSDKMVRFYETWGVVGLEYDEASAQLTYQFDDAGNLCYMEYKTGSGEDEYVASIRIYDDTAEEIDARIKPYTENLVVRDFSWEEAKAKYTADAFNIRENGFVNNGGSAVTGPVEAARLALKEYPDLGEYLSVDVLRDEAAGMWKVTIKSYVDYQSTYAYRDIYLSDDGATQLLVYEGPIGYDEARK